jgi:hypothetical protein
VYKEAAPAVVKTNLEVNNPGYQTDKEANDFDKI